MSLAIVIHTCDSYSFLWEGWDHYFQKNWDFELQHHIYFLNEQVDIDFKNISQVKTGKGEWSDRLRRGLLSISEENILYFQEDFWLQKKFEKPDFDRFYSCFLKMNMNCLRLESGSGEYFTFTKEAPGCHIDEHPLKKLDSRSQYLVSHDVGFWKKDFFLNVLEPGENPWTNELQGTERLRSLNRDLKIYWIRKKWITHCCSRGKLNQNGVEKLIQMKSEAGGR